jgi:hypothetical protein
VLLSCTACSSLRPLKRSLPVGCACSAVLRTITTKLRCGSHWPCQPPLWLPLALPATVALESGSGPRPDNRYCAPWHGPRGMGVSRAGTCRKRGPALGREHARPWPGQGPHVTQRTARGKKAGAKPGARWNLHGAHVPPGPLSGRDKPVASLA